MSLKKLIIVAVTAAVFVSAVWGVRWFVLARSKASVSSCLNGLRQIDGAAQQWAFEHEKGTDDAPIWNNLVGPDRYMLEIPVCPSGRHIFSRTSLRWTDLFDERDIPFVTMMTNKWILTLLFGGLLLCAFRFLLDRLQPDWTVRLGSAEYGITVIKSQVFFVIRDAAKEVSDFITAAGIGLLVFGIVGGVCVSRRRDT